jgi:uncharacterized protein YjbI with pentapeptide repeats
MVARVRFWLLHKSKKIIVIILISAIIMAVFIRLIIVGYQFDWTGFNGKDKSDKTLYDWLQLLIIPFALAIIAIFFNRAERKNERKISSDNQQEAALQAYLDKMSELLLKENLRKSETDSEVRNMARARTLTVLPGLDAARKGSIVEFLYETNLISNELSIIDLHNANLNYINLWASSLPNIDLSGAYLMSSLIGHSNMSNAKLTEVRLTEANLDGINLSGANLSGAWIILVPVSWTGR